MIIDKDLLRAWFRSKTLSPTRIHETVAVNFCQPNTAKGYCTTDCNNCKPYLTEAFQALNRVKPSYPYKFLARALQVSAATMMDDNPRSAILPKDWTGEDIERDPFLAILEEI